MASRCASVRPGYPGFFHFGPLAPSAIRHLRDVGPPRKNELALGLLQHEADGCGEQRTKPRQNRHRGFLRRTGRGGAGEQRDTENKCRGWLGGVPIKVW